MNRKQTLLLGAAAALAIFGVMALSILDTEPWAQEGTTTDSENANNISTIVDTLFGKQVIAFEILGILLTAAMIGALVIARPLGVAPDESHYTVPSEEQEKASEAISKHDAFSETNMEGSQ
jgi:hypothetical protein